MKDINYENLLEEAAGKIVSGQAPDLKGIDLVFLCTLYLETLEPKQIIDLINTKQTETQLAHLVKGQLVDKVYSVHNPQGGVGFADQLSNFIQATLFDAVKEKVKDDLTAAKLQASIGKNDEQS